MAGDWIKMRTDLYRDPKVCAMADLLMETDYELSPEVTPESVTLRNALRNVTRNARCVTRNAVVGALVSVWGVLRVRGKRQEDDLFIYGANLSVIDDISDMPGFGVAMVAVGWVEKTDYGIILPYFFSEYNSCPSQSDKSNNAERQRRFREKTKSAPVTLRNAPLRNVTVTLRNATEERRGEESIKRKEGNARAADPPSHFSIPENLDTPEFRDAWADWVADRERRQRPLTPAWAAEQLRDLAAVGPTAAVACIRLAISRKWLRLVIDKPAPPTKPKSRGPTAAELRAAEAKADAERLEQHEQHLKNRTEGV